ncbi:hypothetical protein PA0080 [Candidatus Phytoplasma australiense]|uniref:Uncharacterized protein n=1 Tax=Phytoplasma australiense TaxID=59748 RepID=B1V8Y3_PHYAS|nr:hypothetical protein PA0080 [Candidatus Phytoplasma australiense]
MKTKNNFFKWLLKWLLLSVMLIIFLSLVIVLFKTCFPSADSLGENDKWKFLYWHFKSHQGRITIFGLTIFLTTSVFGCFALFRFLIRLFIYKLLFKTLKLNR